MLCGGAFCVTVKGRTMKKTETIVVASPIVSTSVESATPFYSPLVYTSQTPTPAGAHSQTTIYTAESPVQRAAIELYDLGFNIAPTKPGSKMPFRWRVLVGTRISRDYIVPLFDNGAGIMVLTGRLSMNLWILDCDTQQDAARQAEQFKRRDLHPWRVNTARGAHFWGLSPDGELGNTSGEGWQFWGSMHYCLCPPAVHPTGAIYEWAERSGKLPPVIGLADLDWLQLKTRAVKRKSFDPHLIDADPLACLSKRNREFIKHGAPELTRNIRLFSAACDLHGNDFHMNEAIDILTPAAQSSGLSHSEITETIKKAFRQLRTPAKQNHTNFKPLPTWARAVTWARSHKWQALNFSVMNSRGKPTSITVTSGTARDVFIALCERSRRDSADVFRASRREVAELANMTRFTIDRAIACLVAAGYIITRGTSTNGASLFAFGPEVLRHEASNTNGSDISGQLCNKRTDARADVFRRGALGKTAELIWQAILPPNTPATKAEIARRVGCDRATVGRVLSADGLPKWGLASEIRPRLWIGNGADDRYLADVAVKSGTSGKAAARRARYAVERQAYASSTILKSKRQWERVHIGESASDAETPIPD